MLAAVNCNVWFTGRFLRVPAKLYPIKKLNLFSTLNNASLRTHTCGELRESDVGKQVILCGWLYNTRVSSSFLLIKDAYGVTQVTLEPTLRIGLPPCDSVIRVHGVVQSRPPNGINKSMRTGMIEIKASKVEALNSASECIPFKMKEKTGVHEQLGMKYRYLQLRQPEFQRRLRFRSEFSRKIRNYLCEDRGFVDIETPCLFKRTPGGAQEFIVPSQFRGQFYSLPQSPQQFKQLLMVAGVDRYMQIARCFRDELARPDRQPEFTQLDIEASFISKEDIYNVVESALAYAWSEVCKYNEETEELKIPFPRMSYEEAMEKYGSDKPDVRFDMELENFRCRGNEQFAFFVVPAGYANVLSKRFFSKLLSLVIEKDALRLSIMPHDKLKLDGETNSSGLPNLKPGEVAILASGTDHPWRKALGTARDLIAKELNSKGFHIYKPGFFFLWVENFPLFSKNEFGGFVSEHHPFTAPVESEVDLLYTEPAMVHGQHYDLVCNGQEVGGGSMRIHRADMQRYVLENILREDVTPLRHLLEALSFGAPPHGGIALGLDRLIAILTKARTVRDVIAFPKTSEGRDLLSNSPDAVSDADLDRYFIRILREEQ